MFWDNYSNFSVSEYLGILRSFSPMCVSTLTLATREKFCLQMVGYFVGDIFYICPVYLFNMAIKMRDTFLN